LATFPVEDVNGVTRITTSCSSTNTFSIQNASGGLETIDFSPTSPDHTPCFQNLTYPTSPNSETLNQQYLVGAGFAGSTLTLQGTGQDVACNEAQNTSNVEIPNAWLMTTGGDTYSGEKFSILRPSTIIETNNLYDQFGLPVIDGDLSLPFLSTNLLATQESGLALDASQNEFILSSYSDLNSTPRIGSTSTWFEFMVENTEKKLLSSHIISDANGLDTPADTSTWISNFLPPATMDPDEIYAIQVDDDLVINQGMVCNNKVIIFVGTSGTPKNLTINPGFEISSPETGCIFVVSGTTTIGEGQDLASGGLTTVYDVVEAFIITDSFISSYDTQKDGLIIRGGVITNSLDPSSLNEFHRDNNLQRNQNAPSELIVYDGTRYIYTFEEILTYPQKRNPKEKLFVRTL